MTALTTRSGRSVGVPEARPARTTAESLLLTGLTWGAVAAASGLLWGQLGSRGREDVARLLGVSAEQLTPYVLAALTAEKVAAKGLLFGALYCWLRGR